MKKSKNFDCVESKRRAQERLFEAYESRKGEFSSYAEFLNARARESEWQRTLWASLSRNRRIG